MTFAHSSLRQLKRRVRQCGSLTGIVRNKRMLTLRTFSCRDRVNEIPDWIHERCPERKHESGRVRTTLNASEFYDLKGNRGQGHRQSNGSRNIMLLQEIVNGHTQEYGPLNRKKSEMDYGSIHVNIEI